MRKVPVTLHWIVENRAHLRASSSTFPSAIAALSLRVKCPSASFSAVDSDAICGTDCEMGESSSKLIRFCHAALT